MLSKSMYLEDILDDSVKSINNGVEKYNLKGENLKFTFELNEEYPRSLRIYKESSRKYEELGEEYKPIRKLGMGDVFYNGLGGIVVSSLFDEKLYKLIIKALAGYGPLGSLLYNRFGGEIGNHIAIEFREPFNDPKNKKAINIYIVPYSLEGEKIGYSPQQIIDLVLRSILSKDWKIYTSLFNYRIIVNGRKIYEVYDTSMLRFNGEKFDLYGNLSISFDKNRESIGANETEDRLRNNKGVKIVNRDVIEEIEKGRYDRLERLGINDEDILIAPIPEREWYAEVESRKMGKRKREYRFAVIDLSKGMVYYPNTVKEEDLSNFLSLYLNPYYGKFIGKHALYVFKKSIK